MINFFDPSVDSDSPSTLDREIDPENHVMNICKTLESEYGNPRHGNKADPVDELVYIILSTRTREPRFMHSFDLLKIRFPSWESVSIEDVEDIESAITSSGLGKLKTLQIVTIFDRLRTTFGRVTLDPLRSMPTEDAEAFLVSLPGVSAKVAKCVLMYSLGRQVLPVDVHVHRVARRLGFRTKTRPDTSQDLIEAAFPPDLRYGFHVNAVAHGRLICRPRNPRCQTCCVSQWCNYFHLNRRQELPAWN